MGGTELSGTEARAEGAVFFQTEVLTETTDEPSPHKAGRLAWFLRLHQPGPHCFPYPGDSMRPHPTQISEPPKLFPVGFPYQWHATSPRLGRVA